MPLPYCTMSVKNYLWYIGYFLKQQNGKKNRYFSLSISTSREHSIFSHNKCILNASMHLGIMLDNCIFRCMAELPLNNDSLKHNRFTLLEKHPVYYKQFITLIIQYGGDITLIIQYGGDITLIIQYGGDISLSRSYFHSPLTHENT